MLFPLSRQPSARVRMQGRPGNLRGDNRRLETVGVQSVGIISWIVLGAIAGFLASLVMGNREGLLMMIVLGIVGALVGGYLAQAVLHKGDVTGVNVESIVIAVIGAVIVIAIYRAVAGGRSRSSL